MDVSFTNIIEIGFWGIHVANHSITGMRFMVELLIVCLLCVADGYLIGSISPAIVISKRVFGKDIRECGSGNAGMTNMFRVYGKKGGLLTLLGDALKTFFSTVIGYLLYGYIGAWLSGLFCVLGHIFPIYYRFKGGKGVLVTAILLLLTDWPVFVIGLLIFVLVLAVSEMVSLASVMAAITMPLFLHEVYSIFYGDGAVAGIRLPIAIGIAVIIVIKHIPNIKRIMNGNENKVVMPWNKKKSDAKEKGVENRSASGVQAGPGYGLPNPNTSKKKQERKRK